MIDVEERARRAGAAARTEARARASLLAPPAHGPARSRSSVLVAASIGLVALLVAVAVVTGGVPPRLEIEPLQPDPSGTGAALPVPEIGDVVAAQLADGTPVFVTQAEPGEVLVLDAVDPYLPHGARHLLYFCRPHGLFEDLRFGSRFDQRGNLIGGPGPTGLALYPSELSADGGTVRVVGSSDTAPARDAPRGEPGGPQGRRCVLDEGTSRAEVVVHRRPAEVPELDGAEVPSDRWVWAALVLAGPVDRLVVCDVDGTCGSSPIVATHSELPPGGVVPPTTFVALARSAGDGRIDLAFSPDELLVAPEGATVWHPVGVVQFPG
jgi:hypothetical protein